MDRLSKSLTTTCEGLGMLHHTFNKQTIVFAEKFKEI